MDQVSEEKTPNLNGEDDSRSLGNQGKEIIAQ
jgi:hypothetical protein